MRRKCSRNFKTIWWSFLRPHLLASALTMYGGHHQDWGRSTGRGSLGSRGECIPTWTAQCFYAEECPKHPRDGSSNCAGCWEWVRVVFPQTHLVFFLSSLVDLFKSRLVIKTNYVFISKVYVWFHRYLFSNYKTIRFQLPKTLYIDLFDISI